jgi:hypothetical protein
MNRTARRETKCRPAVHKLIISLPFPPCQPSGMLIHRQNLYARCGKQRIGRREVQSH